MIEGPAVVDSDSSCVALCGGKEGVLGDILIVMEKSGWETGISIRVRDDRLSSPEFIWPFYHYTFDMGAAMHNNSMHRMICNMRKLRNGVFNSG